MFILKEKKDVLVLSAVDYSQKETMYEQMRKALIKFQGEEFCPQKGASMTFRLKEKLVHTSENDEVLYSRRRLGQTSVNIRGRMAQREEHPQIGPEEVDPPVRMLEEDLDS